MLEAQTAILIFGSILGILLAGVLVFIYDAVYVNRKIRQPFAKLGWRFQKLDASHQHLTKMFENKRKRYKTPAINTTGLQIYHARGRDYVNILVVEKRDKGHSIELKIS